MATNASDQRAPEPHWLTVSTALASLVLSLIALCVSARSCSTASDSLRISQQPYLSIRTNLFTVVRMASLRNSTGIVGTYNSPPLVVGNTIDLREAAGDVAIRLEFEIENSGNTPATPEELVFDFKMPDGWELIVPWTSEGVRLTKGTNRVGVTVETLSPRKSVQKSITVGLRVTEDARVDFLKKRGEASINGVAIARIRGPVQVNGELQYRDEIGQREPLRWCKVIQMNLPTPLDCTAVR